MNNSVRGQQGYCLVKTASIALRTCGRGEKCENLGRTVPARVWARHRKLHGVRCLLLRQEPIAGASTPLPQGLGCPRWIPPFLSRNAIWYEDIRRSTEIRHWRSLLGFRSIRISHACGPLTIFLFPTLISQRHFSLTLWSSWESLGEDTLGLVH